MLTVLLLVLIGTASWAYARNRRGRPPAPPANPSESREPAPERLESPDAGSLEIQGILMESNGAPIVDFDRLDELAASLPPDRAGSIRDQGRRAWLLHLRDFLGPEARLTETDGVRVLSSWPHGVACAAARFMSVTRKRIGTLLDCLAKFPDDQPITLITFDTEDAYYHYVANYYPEEGEFAFSSGMFIDAGCPHFVALREDLAQLEPVIAHEMTHHALAHLQLPLWLDEGITVNSEQRLAIQYRHPGAALELLGKHHEFWNEQTIQEFWSGRSFHRPDEGNALSYDLARAIVGLVGRDWPSFREFASRAQRADGGAAAARAALSLDLGELAAAAINMPRSTRSPPVRWSPAPHAWHGVAVKAAIRQPLWPFSGPSAR
jgi:hypothetical protein